MKNMIFLLYQWTGFRLLDEVEALATPMLVSIFAMLQQVGIALVPNLSAATAQEVLVNLLTFFQSLV